MFCLFLARKCPNYVTRVAKIAKKFTFKHLLLESSKNFEGHIDQKFYQIHLEHQKIFNLDTNFVQISPSKAEIYQKL